MYKIKYIIYNTSALSFYLKVSEFSRSIINTYINYLRERETTTKKNYTKKITKSYHYIIHIKKFIIIILLVCIYV